MAGVRSTPSLQGTSRRWDQIAAMLPARTLEEVVRMVKVNMAAGNTDLQRESSLLPHLRNSSANASCKSMLPKPDSVCLCSR